MFWSYQVQGYGLIGGILSWHDVTGGAIEDVVSWCMVYGIVGLVERSQCCMKTVSVGPGFVGTGK